LVSTALALANLTIKMIVTRYKSNNYQIEVFEVQAILDGKSHSFPSNLPSPDQ
jgi:hypothetical protein